MREEGRDGLTLARSRFVSFTAPLIWDADLIDGVAVFKPGAVRRTVASERKHSGSVQNAK